MADATAEVIKVRAEKEYKAYRPDVIPPYDGHVEILQTYRGSLPTNMRNEIALRLSLSLKAYEISRAVFDERGNPTLEKVQLARKETVTTALTMLHYLDGALPAIHDEGPFEISLLDNINNFGFVLGQFIDPLWRVRSPGLFDEFTHRISANRAATSTQLLSKDELAEGKTVDPKDHPGTPKEIIRAYLTGTPFVKLFDSTASIGWKNPKARFRHTWIVAPPDAGKTTLLKALITYDLKAVEQGKASIIVIEGEGQILNALESRELFDRVALDIIDPADQGLSLNPFDYTGVTEQTETSVVNLLTFVIGGLLGAEMTPRQRGFFRRLAVQMLHTPSSTLLTMLDYLRGMSKNDGFFETGDQLAWRIEAILSESSTLKRIFSKPENHANYAAFMNRPGVTVIHPNRSLLGKDGAGFFGRLALAQILRTAECNRSVNGTDIPCYVYIDESHTFIANDTNIVEMLDSVRKYNVGLILAHQRLNQLSNEVVDALYHDAGTILASRVREPKLLASAMHCEPEVIEQCRQGEFALCIRDQIDSATRVRIPAAALENLPKRPHKPRPTHSTEEPPQVMPPPAPPQADHTALYQGILDTLGSIREVVGSLRDTIRGDVRKEVHEAMAEYELKPRPTVSEPGTTIISRPVQEADYTEAPQATKTTHRKRGRKTRFDTKGTSEP